MKVIGLSMVSSDLVLGDLPTSFPCTSCGLCCQRIAGVAVLAEYDLGNGCCQHYSMTQGCLIYATRPDECHIDRGYELFFHEMLSRADYYRQNAEVCNALQIQAGLDEKFRVLL